MFYDAVVRSDENRPLRVALGQYDIGWQTPETSLQRAEALTRDAAERGADLVVLPEMCTTGFTMDSARYCEQLDGPSVKRLTHLARECGINLIAGVATRTAAGEFHNSSLFINRDGVLVAEYRKQRLFAFAEEDQSYAPGDSDVIVDIEGVRCGLLICFDLRFPELFRAIAPAVDALIVIASWPSARQLHWDTLLRARAIESQAYVIGVNRTGVGGGVEYGGGSVVYGPWGENVAAATGDRAAIAEIDFHKVTEARAKFPFVLAPSHTVRQ